MPIYFTFYTGIWVLQIVPKWCCPVMILDYLCFFLYHKTVLVAKFLNAPPNSSDCHIANYMIKIKKGLKGRNGVYLEVDPFSLFWSSA